MQRMILAAGVAALAISAPLAAEPGKGNGGNKGHGGHAKVEGGRSGGEAKVRGNGGNRGGEIRIARQDGNRGGDKVRVRGNDDSKGRGERVVRVRDDDRKVVKVRARDDDRTVRIRDRDDDRRVVIRDRDDDDFQPRWGLRGSSRGLIDGCPPGLDRKDNGCLPPGQAKKMVGTVLPATLTSAMLGGAYRSWYRDDDDYLYRMDDGLIYRIDRDTNRIAGLIPAYDRDYYYYPVGEMYPADYNYYNVPYQYRSYYPDSNDWQYRYGDGAIYQIDPKTQLISSIVSLLAGDLGVGQRLPLGYSAYNVPLDYRDRYADSATDWYRYNDGYIYRVDPTTQLVTAVVQALV